MVHSDLLMWQYQIVALMEEYYTNIRAKIIPQNSVYAQRFFLSNTGNEFTKISERMKEVAELFGLTVTSSGLQHKVVATEAFKYEDNVPVQNIQSTCVIVLPLVKNFITIGTIIW